MINVGDVVEATRNGGRDRRGLPMEIPVKGRVYRVTSIYETPYGLGCALAGMDSRPYRGYLLFVGNSGKLPLGWYFRKADADPAFTELIKRIRIVEKETAK